MANERSEMCLTNQQLADFLRRLTVVYPEGFSVSLGQLSDSYNAIVMPVFAVQRNSMGVTVSLLADVGTGNVIETTGLQQQALAPDIGTDLEFLQVLVSVFFGDDNELASMISEIVTKALRLPWPVMIWIIDGRVEYIDNLSNEIWSATLMPERQ